LDARKRETVVIVFPGPGNCFVLPRHFLYKVLDKLFILKHKGLAAVCGGLAGSGQLKRGDLGQLAPRKKLLKSFSSSQKIF
jgi:hypothetical protein